MYKHVDRYENMSMQQSGLTEQYKSVLENNDNVCPRCLSEEISSCKCEMCDKICCSCSIGWYKCEQHGYIVHDGNISHDGNQSHILCDDE